MAFCVALTEVEAVQVFAPVTVTVKVPAVLTVMLAVLAPVDQAYVPPPPAVSVVLEPAQKDNVPEMVGEGTGFTVTVREAVPVQPFALVAVTVYVPAAATDIAAVFAPVDQT